MSVRAILRNLPALAGAICLSHCFTGPVLDRIYEPPRATTYSLPVTSIAVNADGLFRLYFGDEKDPDQSLKACSRQLAPLELEDCPSLKGFTPVKRFSPVSLPAGQIYLPGKNILLSGSRRVPMKVDARLPPKIESAQLNQNAPRSLDMLYLSGAGVCYAYEEAHKLNLFFYKGPCDDFPQPVGPRLRIERLWDKFTFEYERDANFEYQVFRSTPEMPLPPEAAQGAYHKIEIDGWTTSKWEPGEALALPAAIIGDMLTSPFQLAWFIITGGKGLHGGPF